MRMPDAPPPPFAVHARSVVRSVRGAFNDLLLAMGADPVDPQSLSRQTGMTRTLAWKISKIVQTDDPTLALQHMPGSSGIRILLRAAERAGVDAERLATARTAVREYERLIDVHCGDRATLEMMGGELSELGRQQRDEQHRKLLFQGASYVWGAQARVSLKCGVVGPGAERGLVDFASMNALVDFRRLRPNVSWVLAARRSRNDDGTPMPTSGLEAIDPALSGTDQVPLMKEFCSQPVPRIRRVQDPMQTSFELIEGPVGNMGALTCVFGAIQRGIPLFRSETNEWGEHQATSDIPAELLMMDLFIHESFTFAFPPEALLLSDVEGISGPECSRTRLPLTETLSDLGMSASLPATPEVPRYRRMVERVFERMNWSASEFRGYRMKIVYPAYPTSLVLRYRLPEGP